MDNLPEAIESQNWAIVLNSLYKKEIPAIKTDDIPDHVSSHEEKYQVDSSGEVPAIDKAGLSSKEVAKELRHLDDLGLIDMVHRAYHDDYGGEIRHSEVFRLNKEGFQIIHDLRQNKKEEDWETQRQEWRKRQQTLQQSVAEINNTLTAATIILAGTAVVQSIDIFSISQYQFISIVLADAIGFIVLLGTIVLSIIYIMR